MALTLTRTRPAPAEPSWASTYERLLTVDVDAAHLIEAHGMSPDSAPADAAQARGWHALQHLRPAPWDHDHEDG